MYISFSTKAGSGHQYFRVNTASCTFEMAGSAHQYFRKEIVTCDFESNQTIYSFFLHLFNLK